MIGWFGSSVPFNVLFELVFMIFDNWDMPDLINFIEDRPEDVPDEV